MIIDSSLIRFNSSPPRVMLSLIVLERSTECLATVENRLSSLETLAEFVLAWFTRSAARSLTEHEAAAALAKTRNATAAAAAAAIARGRMDSVKCESCMCRSFDSNSV